VTTSEAGGERVRGIGARLRAAREKRGFTVLQAAERLHVDARILEALEAENFAVLGADVYVRGHMRRYAEAVGESATELQELYAGAATPVTPDLTRIPRATEDDRPSALLLPALLVVVGVALVGVFWWLRSLPHQTGQPLEPVPTSQPAAGSGGATAGTAGGANSGAPAGTGTAAGETATRPAGGSLPTSRTAETQLDVRFSALSWVEISDAEGRRLLQGLYPRGSAREVRGTAPLRVVLGNAPAVDLELDGRPLQLAGLVHRNGSAYLSIDRAGRVSAAAPRLAHGE
jgi:cytoskeleton protein RodZ